MNLAAGSFVKVFAKEPLKIWPCDWERETRHKFIQAIIRQHVGEKIQSWERKKILLVTGSALQLKQLSNDAI